MTALAPRAKQNEHMWCWFIVLVMVALGVSYGCCWVIQHGEGVFRAWANLEAFIEKDACRRFLQSFGFSRPCLFPGGLCAMAGAF